MDKSANPNKEGEITFLNSEWNSYQLILISLDNFYCTYVKSYVLNYWPFQNLCSNNIKIFSDFLERVCSTYSKTAANIYRI